MLRIDPETNRPLTQNQRTLILEIANVALGMLDTFEAQAGKWQGVTFCTPFDTATAFQKIVLIVEVLSKLCSPLELLEQSNLEEAALDYLLINLADEIEVECTNDDSGNHFRSIAYNAWSEALLESASAEIAGLEPGEPSIRGEELFLTEKSQSQDVEFWREYIVEELYCLFNIGDRDWQITADNPLLFEGGNEVKASVGLDDYFIVRFPSYSREDADIALRKFQLIRGSSNE